jgi:hypothetical protein
MRRKYVAERFMVDEKHDESKDTLLLYSEKRQL